MNILLINHYAGSPELGMEYRPFYMAQNWAKAGHKVTIIAADHSHLRLKNPHPVEDFEDRKCDNFNFCWVKTPDYNHDTGGRGRNVFTFVSKLWKNCSMLAERYSPDVIIASSTYPFDSYPANRLAKLCGVPLIWEVHDLWPLTQTALYDYNPRNPLVLAIETAQRYAIRHSAHVVSIIPKGDEYLAQYGLDRSYYTHIPNGVSLSKKGKAPPKSYTEAIAKAKEQGKFVVMYCGSVGGSNAINELVIAAPALRDKAEIMIVGNGGYRVMLKRIVKENNLENVQLFDAIPPEQARELMKEADCLYLGASDSPLYAYGIGMNKLYDYMLAGRPILLAVDCADDPVARCGCGVSLGGCTPEKIVEGIERLRACPVEELAEMGRKGTEYVTGHHDYAKLADAFLEVLARSAGK